MFFRGEDFSSPNCVPLSDENTGLHSQTMFGFGSYCSLFLSRGFNTASLPLSIAYLGANPSLFLLVEQWIHREVRLRRVAASSPSQQAPGGVVLPTPFEKGMWGLWSVTKTCVASYICSGTRYRDRAQKHAILLSSRASWSSRLVVEFFSH